MFAPTQSPFYFMRLSEEDLSKIGAALGALPYRDVAELLHRMARDIEVQKEAATVNDLKEPSYEIDG